MQCKDHKAKIIHYVSIDINVAILCLVSQQPQHLGARCKLITCILKLNIIKFMHILVYIRVLDDENNVLCNVSIHERTTFSDGSKSWTSIN